VTKKLTQIESMLASANTILKNGPKPGSRDDVLRQILTLERECLYGNKQEPKKIKEIMEIILKNSKNAI